MSDRLPMPFLAALLGAALSLSACGTQGADKDDLANLDNQIAGNNIDPALTSALEDQILVDPTLASQSNKNAVRPAQTPVQAQYPAAEPGDPVRQDAGGQATQGAQHARLASAARGGGTACGAGVKFDYDAKWAGRLPAAFPVYPGGRLNEAAGNDAGDCRVRVATFRSGDAPAKVIGWYRDRAMRAGFSAEPQRRGNDHVLAGTRGEGAFYVIVTPVQNGSDVSLIANQGR